MRATHSSRSRRRRSTRLAAIAILALAIGCRGKSTDAPCGTAAGSFYAIAKAELDKSTVDDTTRRAVIDQLPAMRDSLDNACRDDSWSAAVRNCLASSTDHVQIEKCERQLTEVQRAGLDRAARGDSGSR